MKVLLVHNRYQQRGGEDAVVETERELLAQAGVEVELFQRDNDHIRGTASRLKASAAAVYNPWAVGELKAILLAYKPDVVHVHNWFPTLSPGIFSACKQMGTAVVHTLHNYRLLCIKASHYRDGKPCEDCMGKTLRLPGIAHKCYRGSRAGSLAATAAMVAHWQIGTWQHSIDRFIALSEFAKAKVVEGGLASDKVAVKPNSLSCDPGVRPGDGDYVVYVGRLTDEKGIPTLLECWRQGRDLPKLRVVGSGPLEAEVRAMAASFNNVEWVGQISSDEVLEVIGRGRAVICPSLWYEGMPRIAVESLAVGTPVIASRLGTYIEMIEHGRSGMLFEAGRPDSLLACVREYVSGSDSEKMRAAARRRFELSYSPAINVQSLVGIYNQVLVGTSEDSCMEPARAA